MTVVSLTTVTFVPHAEIDLRGGGEAGCPVIVTKVPPTVWTEGGAQCSARRRR